MSFKKHILSLVIASISLTWSGTVLAEESFPYVAEAVSDHVYIRAGQSADYESLLQLKKGDRLIVQGKSYTWYKVALPKRALSFIRQDFVASISKEEGVVTGDRVNVRAKANLNAAVVCQANKGQNVFVLGNKEGWLQIVPIENCSGWIKEGSLSFYSNDVKSFQEAQAKEPIIPITPSAKIDTKASIPPVTVEIMGILESKKDNQNDYLLMVDQKPLYVIRGFGYLLNDFVHYRVKIQGVIEQPSTNSSEQLPVLNIQKIMLVF